MDEKEREFIRRKTQLQLSSETYSEPSSNRERYQDMSEDQKLNFIDFLMKSLDDSKAEMERLRLSFEEDKRRSEEASNKLRESFEEDKRKSDEAFKKLLEELKNLRLEFSKLLEEKKSLQSLLDKKEGEIKSLQKNHFGPTSLKSNKGKKKGKDDINPEGPSYEEKRDGFDGTKETYLL